MTVRINKPTFDLREKLASLTKKVGLVGVRLLASENVYDARSVLNAGRKNMIINGAMTINQRYGTTSYTVPNATGGSYTLDRWAVNEATDGAVNVNMDGDPRSGNGTNSNVQEFYRAMQIACTNGDASISTNQNTHFFQNIEGYNITHLQWGTVRAAPVTLSFWVKCNVPGIYCVGLENSATDRSCIREYEVKPGYRWQKVVLTFPGCQDGVWDTANGVGIRLRFCLATGDDYNDGVDGIWGTTDELATPNQTNWMINSNSRYFITGVQLEKGRTATEFEHRSYGEELALCQRYYVEIGNAVSPLAVSVTSRAAATKVMGIHLPVAMRAVPTVGTTGYVRISKSGSYQESNSSLVIDGITPNIYLGESGVDLSIWWNSNLSVVANSPNDVYGGFSAGAGFSAEL
jgi:hypothetical protein